MPSRRAASSKKKKTHNAPRAPRAPRAAAAPATAPVRLPTNAQRFFESEFRPIALSRALRAEPAVQLLQQAIECGALEMWSFGRKGTHVSSRLVTADGYEDTLTSPDPSDDDFASLARAHIARLRQLIGLDPDPITGGTGGE